MNSNLQIIVIPGIMGSTLNNRFMQIWPWSDYIVDQYKSLKNIRNKHIYAKKIESYTYKELIKQLKTVSGNVTKFPYDWRQNNIEHLDELKEKIDPNADEIIIVAHSMGGIVGKLFLNHFRDSEFVAKITKIITLGTPWNGAMDAYKTLKYGKAIPEKKLKGFFLNEETSKEITSYFPSIYQLLPSNNYCGLSKQIETQTLVSYCIDGEEYTDHDKFFDDHLKSKFIECKLDYTKVIDEFRDLLKEDIPQHVQHIEIIGVNEGTIAGISVNSLDEAEGDFRSGDGTVPLFSALTNQENSFFANKVDHTDLPKDSEVLNLVKDIINKDYEVFIEEFVESEKIFRDINSPFNSGYNGKIIKIACPVEVSLMNKDGNIVYGAIDTIDEDGLEEISKEDYNIKTIGSTTYILFDEKEITTENFDKIVIQAYDYGPTTVTVDEYVKGINVKRNAFKTFIINPEIQAELNLSRDLENNKLFIESLNNETSQIDSSIHVFENQNEIDLPETTAQIIGSDTLIINEEEFVLKGPAYFNLTELKKGTYEIDNTFIKVKEEIYTLDGANELLLSLDDGINFIEYFTKDIFGNIEKSKKIKALVIPSNSIEVEMEFLSHQYEINIGYSETYNEVVELYNLETGIIHIQFDNNQDVYGNVIYYRVPHRKLNISFINIFNKEEKYEFTIAEDAIASIFEGIASPETIDQFTDFLRMNKPKLRFIRPDSSIVYSANTEENITKCTSIKIEDALMKIRILKDKKYNVSFQNLAEDILLKKVKSYSLEFKLIDNDWNKETTSKELQFFIKVIGLKDTIIFDNKDVRLDLSKNVYVADIDLVEINKKISQDYWLTNTEPAIEVNIIEKTSMNSLRSQNISIRIE